MTENALDRYIERLESTAADLEPRVHAMETALYGDEKAGHQGIVMRLKIAQDQVAAHDEFLKSAKVLASVAKWMGATSAASTISLVVVLYKLFLELP